MCLLVNLFFLVDLFFLINFLHEAALRQNQYFRKIQISTVVMSAFSYFEFDVFARSCKNHLTRKQQMRLRLGLWGRVLASVGLIPKPARIHRTAAAEPPPGKTVVALPKMGEWRPCCRPSPICSLPT